jgi:hypothetical protein
LVVKTSICHFKPECRWQSVKWWCTTQPKKKIFKKALSAGTILNTVFCLWGQHWTFIIVLKHYEVWMLAFVKFVHKEKCLKCCFTKTTAGHIQVCTLLRLLRSSDRECFSTHTNSHKFTPSDSWLFERQLVRIPLYTDKEAVWNALCQQLQIKDICISSQVEKHTCQSLISVYRRTQHINLLSKTHYTGDMFWLPSSHHQAYVNVWMITDHCVCL